MADDETIDLGIAGLTDATLAGRGGFAAVYRANQPDFRRTVAVKVLSAPETDLVARSRFDRECQAMGSLSEHPNIVTLYDAGFLADGRAYLVMAFMEGGSLHELAHGPDKPSWQEVASIGTKLAGALETAHRAGILHRDIKPANVLISTYGEPQLTDFGIARIAGGHETTSSHITASLPYAPPEILDGQPPTARSDVYSLAATLVHLLIGSPPFTGDTDSGFAPLLRRVYEQEIPDLAAYGVPPALDVVLRTAMAKDPARRQRSAEELGRQIQQAQRTLGAPVGEMVVAGVARDAVVDADIPTVRDLPGVPPVPPVVGVPPIGSTTPPPPPGPPPAGPGASVPAPRDGTGTTPPPPAAAAFGAVPTPPEAPTPAGAGGRDNRVLYGAVAAAVIAVLGVVGVLAFTGGDPDEPVTTATPEASAEPDVTPTEEPAPTATPEDAATPTPVATPTPEPEAPTPTPAAPTPTVGPPAPGGPITLGDSVSATLAGGEVARHTFQATAGDVIRFDVTSPDGDARIILNTPQGIPVVGANDCSVQASQTDALLITEAAVTGEYSVDIDLSGGAGSYTLSTLVGVTPAEGEIGFMRIRAQPTTNFQTAWAIADGDLSLVARSSNGRVIAADDDCFGDLDPRIESFLADPDGSIDVAAYTTVPPVSLIGLFNVEGFAVNADMPAATRASFALDLVAGQQLEVLMRSTDADSFITIADESDNAIVIDDDSGGGLDAQVSFVVPADGRYHIQTSFLGDVAGSFSLGVLIN